MNNPSIDELVKKAPIVKELAERKEVIWINPHLAPFDGKAIDGLSMSDIDDAEARLLKFAPFIAEKFPETRENGGIIESPLTVINNMKKTLNAKYNAGIEGTLLLKQDSHLAVAGSVKARGGVYEVLKHTEELAFANNLLNPGNSYIKLADEKCREFFSQYKLQVASTGNLGMSIGIMSAAIGYETIVHMSIDAKQWKKDLLRSRGVTVIEYETDYSAAVIQGRNQSDKDPKSYFVDDENSRDLFLGYSVAAKRIVNQLKANNITVDAEHPMFVYLPCGVGGAPGGITFGLKHIFGDNVHCFFAEPVNTPCMVLGMSTGLNNKISVADIGLSGKTHADGLAVGRASGFVGGVMDTLLSGELTMEDALLYDYMRELSDSEGIFIEPSACASFQGPAKLLSSPEGRKYIEDNNLSGKMPHAVHIAWATGGSMVPQDVREDFKNTFLRQA